MQFLEKIKPDDAKSAKKSWYADRYQTVLVHRNLFIWLTIISFLGITVSVLAVIQVTSSKSIKPYIVEIGDNTGITSVADPVVSVEQFTYQEALRHYFIKKYIKARETYDPATYNYNYNTVVRELSADGVYSEFTRSVRQATPLGSGNDGLINIKIKSVKEITPSPDYKGYAVIVRFLQTKTVGGVPNTEHLAATINYQYSIEGNEDKSVNPMGFQVTSYRVDEESL